MARDVFFFRPNVDLTKVHLDKKTGYMNEHVNIDGKEYAVFGNGKWTGLKPVPKEEKKVVKGAK